MDDDPGPQQPERPAQARLRPLRDQRGERSATRPWVGSAWALLGDLNNTLLVRTSNETGLNCTEAMTPRPPLCDDLVQVLRGMVLLDVVLLALGIATAQSVLVASETAYMCCGFYSCFAATIVFDKRHRQRGADLMRATQGLARSLEKEADADGGGQVRANRGESKWVSIAVQGCRPAYSCLWCPLVTYRDAGVARAAAHGALAAPRHAVPGELRLAGRLQPVGAGGAGGRPAHRTHLAHAGLGAGPAGRGRP